LNEVKENDEPKANAETTNVDKLEEQQ